MPVLLQCLSHSPLMDANRPPPEVEAEARAKIQAARDEIERFQPELTLLFAPDHFNAFFYDFMPPFCIGAAAESIGDYGSAAGPINVASALSVACTEAVLKAGFDMALSYRMQVDHGFSQPLELLCGSLTRYPVIPVFVNGAAPPRPSCGRVLRMGQALGRYLAEHHGEKRILILGSGGISHDPPIPSIASAPPEVRERLIAGRNAPVEARLAKEKRVIQAGLDFAAASPEVGGGELLPLNPVWDNQVLELLRDAKFEVIDRWEDDWITAEGGRGGHEIRAWIAAFGCLSAFGSYNAEVSYYKTIPQWIAGFAVMRATPAPQGLQRDAA
jgi:2,3-dihydroxyphenylpropionate 1,2-dioxygenase